MAPSTGPSTMPNAFRPADGSAQEKSPTPEQIDLETATAAALDEWNDIIAAFHALADAMGPGFQPVDDPNRPPIDTPFGPAITFGSCSIAAIWAWYYGALILAYRAHPSMPAPSVIAVGAAAQQTARYANRVGQILFHRGSDFLQPPLDSGHVGSFSESCLPLFFAGVQFSEPAQRCWLMGRLREIEATTGWATVGLIAAGCERSWVAAYKAGHGPKYEMETGVELGDEQGRVVQETSRHSPTVLQPRDLHTDDAEPYEYDEDSQRRKVLQERTFAPFRKKGGDVMWAYQLYA